MLSKEEILKGLISVQDPELMISVVDLGLIYDLIIEDDGCVHIIMTLTTPACPYGPELLDEIQKTVAAMDGIDKATLELVWNPPWDPVEMATERGKDLLGIW